MNLPTLEQLTAATRAAMVGIPMTWETLNEEAIGAFERLTGFCPSEDRTDRAAELVERVVHDIGGETVWIAAEQRVELVRIEACMHDSGGNPNDGVTVTRRADEAERTAELMRQCGYQRVAIRG